MTALAIILIPPALLYFATLLLVRYWRLRSIPGPFATGFTDVWRQFQMNTGYWPSIVAQLHKKYGTFVRVGPNTVSICDPAAIPTIFTQHGEFLKADSYHPVRVLADGQVKGSVVDMQDEALVSMLKRAVGSAFATKNVLDYEDDVDHMADLLVDAIKRMGSIDLFELLQKFQADFLLRIAFREHTDYLETQKSTAEICSEDRFVHWTKWQAMPKLEHLLYKSSICRGWLSRAKKPPIWVTMAARQYQARQKRFTATGSYQAQGGKANLLTRYLEGADRNKVHLSAETVMKIVSSTISAGVDTTAFTMTTMIYFLLKYPETFQKLQTELNQRVEAGKISRRPLYNETDTLPYLSATIKEAMRLYHFIIVPLERVVPDAGAEIAGQWLPGGTVVGIPAGIVQTDREIFGDDAETFRPDRWIEANDQQRLAMERTMLGFGAGKRICIGRHIAELEIKKVISRLVLVFKMELVDPNYMLEPKSRYTAFPKPFSVSFEEIKGVVVDTT